MEISNSIKTNDLYESCLGYKLNSRPSEKDKVELFIQIFYFRLHLHSPEIIWVKSPKESFHILEKKLYRSFYDGNQNMQIDMIDFSLWKILRGLNIPYRKAFPALQGYQMYWKERWVSSLLEIEIEQIREKRIKDREYNRIFTKEVWDCNWLWHRFNSQRNLMAIELIRQTSEKEDLKKTTDYCNKVISFVKNCFATIQLVDTCIVCENPIASKFIKDGIRIKFKDGFKIPE